MDKTQTTTKTMPSQKAPPAGKTAPKAQAQPAVQRRAFLTTLGIDLTKLTTTLPGSTTPTTYTNFDNPVLVGPAIDIEVQNNNQNNLFAQVVKIVGGSTETQTGTVTSAAATDKTFKASFTGLVDNEDEGTDQLLRVEATDDPNVGIQATLDVETSTLAVISPPPLSAPPGPSLPPQPQTAFAPVIVSAPVNSSVQVFVAQGKSATFAAVTGNGPLYQAAFGKIAFTGKAKLHVRTDRRRKIKGKQTRRLTAYDVTIT
jgi:hypothetical protein